MHDLSQYPRLKKISGPPVLGAQSKVSRVHIPSFGPGSELRDLLVELGITMKTSCKCTSREMQMNVWGVDGCLAHLAEIAEWLREAAADVTWGSTFAAAWNAARKGIVISVVDPYSSIAMLAIERARLARDSKT